MNTINKYYSSNPRLGNKGLYTNIVNRNNETLPNSISQLQQTRYFSGTDAEIYFGDVCIDEVVQISFSLQQNTMPIFGYNSFIADVIPQGSRIINGSFTINFTQSGYLYSILDTLQNTQGDTLNQAAVSNNMTMHKDIKHSMWDKCFDIVMSYGNYGNKFKYINGESVDLSTVIILRGIHLMSCSQEYGTATGNGGQPIYETYTFMARDIEFEYETENVVTDTEEITDDTSVEEVTILDNVSDNTFGIDETACSINKYDDVYIGININNETDNVINEVDLIYDGHIYSLEQDNILNNVYRINTENGNKQLEDAVINSDSDYINVDIVIKYCIPDNESIFTHSSKQAIYITK